MSEIEKLKIECAEAGAPISYVSEPTPTSVRIVFEDAHVALSAGEARDHAAEVWLAER